MKTFCFLLAFVLVTLVSSAQAPVDYASLKTDKKEDFTEGVNKAALQAAGRLLELPLEKDNPERVDAFRYLMRWMSGTPDYNFEIDETATSISKGNDDLLVVYLASMCKFALENKEAAKDKKTLKVNAVRGVLAYCKTQNVKLTGELKKMNKAQEAGALETYLK